MLITLFPHLYLLEKHEDIGHKLTGYFLPLIPMFFIYKFLPFMRYKSVRTPTFPPKNIAI